MAFSLTFSPALTTPAGLPITTLYARIEADGYRRAQPGDSFRVGIISYQVAYYLNAECAANSEMQPLIINDLDRFFVIEGELVPAAVEGEQVTPGGEPVAVPMVPSGLTALQANAKGRLTQCYAHLRSVLTDAFPGITISRV